MNQVEQELLDGMFGGSPEATSGVNERSDPELASEVVAVLETHSALKSGRVHAEVERRWVMVEGSADEREWTELESLALSVQGVAGVILSRCEAQPRRRPRGRRRAPNATRP